MANEVAGKFEGIPMEQLIAAPFKAACDAQMQLAGAAWDYMQKIGFEEKGKTRLLKFNLQRPVETPGGIQTTDLEVQAPFLGLVPIPSLLIDDMSVDFQMEVTSTTQDKSTSTAEASVEGGGGFGLWSVKVQGKVSSTRENTRSSNQTAKYNVNVKARQQPQTEGLSRLMDILATCTAPLSSKSANN